jgi:hypothetical protein
VTGVVLSYLAAVLYAAAAVAFGIADRPILALLWGIGGGIWSFTATMKLYTWQRDREYERLRRQGWLS